MNDSSHVFPGAHGTISVSRIMAEGFSIRPEPAGKAMFGAGIYFYKNDVEGRFLAYKWAELRARQRSLPLADAGVIGVDISFGDDQFFRWGFEEEQAVFDRMKEQKELDPELPLTRELQNAMRERYLNYILNRMPCGCALVLTELPLPPDTPMEGHSRYPGCVVRDVSILPPPPYRKES